MLGVGRMDGCVCVCVCTLEFVSMYVWKCVWFVHACVGVHPFTSICFGV